MIPLSRTSQKKKAAAQTTAAFKFQFAWQTGTTLVPSNRAITSAIATSRSAVATTEPATASVPAAIGWSIRGSGNRFLRITASAATLFSILRGFHQTPQNGHNMSHLTIILSGSPAITERFTSVGLANQDDFGDHEANRHGFSPAP